MGMGILYLVATPIGNLGDLSPRAVEVLRAVDLIAAEDTRRTMTLCRRFDIQTRLESFHDHSGTAKRDRLLGVLREGKSVALVSDGGTPLIADPGYPLVTKAIEAGVRVTTVPGPSAVSGALAVSGFPSERFIFEGYLPVKSGARRKRLSEIAEEARTVIYFESPHRLLKALADIEEVLPGREVCVVKELTKQFEEIFRGSAKEIRAVLAGRTIKGEYVIVIKGKDR